MDNELVEGARVWLIIRTCGKSHLLLSIFIHILILIAVVGKEEPKFGIVILTRIIKKSY